MFSWECFEIATSKTLENIQKNVFSWVLIPDWKFLCKYFSVKENEVLRSTKKREEILRFQKYSPNKSISCEFFRKQSKWRHFIKVAGLLSRFYKPLKMNTPYKISRKTSLVDRVRCPIYHLWLSWKRTPTEIFHVSFPIFQNC